MENEKENNLILGEIQPNNQNYNNLNNNFQYNENINTAVKPLNPQFINITNTTIDNQYNQEHNNVSNMYNSLENTNTEKTVNINNTTTEEYNNQYNKNVRPEIKPIEPKTINITNTNEEQNNQYNENNLNKTIDNENICHKCNSPLESNQQFCTKCGTQRGAINNKICKKCGNIIGEEEKFCSKCGNKSHLDIQSDILDNKKKKNKIITFIIATILITISCTIFCTTILPVLTITTEQLLSEGRYEEAYKKAKKEIKDDILKENVIAYVSYNASTNLKDPSSFVLREAWYDENTHYIALSSNGKNSYGASVPVYYHYYYNEEKKDYELFAVLSSLNNETISSWDTSSEKLEKLLNNIARNRIKELMTEDSLQLKKDSIDNINNLFEKNLLDNVRLLPENTNISSNNSL